MPVLPAGSATLQSLAQLAGPDGRVSDANADAAEQFEAWMVGMLAKSMRSTVHGGPWSEGATATFADLFDQEIGRRVAENGGFGLKDSVLKALHGRETGPVPPRPRPHASTPATQPLRAVADGIARITSRFGVRADPFTGESKHHHGLDLAATEGTPIGAAAEGVVRFAGKRGGYGNVVILEHKDGTETRYAHCRDLAVKPGQRVGAGDRIATVGSTGRSTGPHLHFEVRKAGSPVDPESWLADEKSAQAPLGPTDSAPER